jgi:lysyl-tRNA synthetase class 2
MNSSLPDEEERLVHERRAKLAALRAEGYAYAPFHGARDARASELHALYDARDADDLAREDIVPTLAGRLLGRRVMGRIGFADLHDATGRLQLHLSRDRVGDELWERFVAVLDLGDIVRARGRLMKTRTGELSLDVRELELLAKSLRPLPEKHKGLRDPEQRYRRRYVDLMTNPGVREIFVRRSRAVTAIRRYLDALDFLEVETPMMHTLPGGAAARPFLTHHNALDLTLYLRIAPELYLKRLIVGGFERVYELNRNFRNEGVSTRHNPEFTMLELYQAYAGWQEMMALTEGLLRHTALQVLGSTRLPAAPASGGERADAEVGLDLGPPFQRRRMDELVAEALGLDTAESLRDPARLRRWLYVHGIVAPPGSGPGGLLFALFEGRVERRLVAPTFVTHYPVEVSPLAQNDPSDPFFTERFELYLKGHELANGFSELNDPEEQARRFRAQLERRAAGDEEAMAYDADYVEALEYGMPPTGGLGVGIDRFVMALNGVDSIREVLLFPLLKPRPD